MGRPKKSDDQKAVRVTCYVKPETFEKLRRLRPGAPARLASFLLDRWGEK